MLSSGPTTSVLWYQILESSRTAKEDRNHSIIAYFSNLWTYGTSRKPGKTRSGLTDIARRENDIQLSAGKMALVERLECPSLGTAELRLPGGFVEAIQLGVEITGASELRASEVHRENWGAHPISLTYMQMSAFSSITNEKPFQS